MRSKHKHKSIGKTRGHRVEKKRHVQLLQHTGPQHDEKWEGEDENQHSGSAQGQGNQDSDSSGKREDTQINEEAEQIRDKKDPNESIHPGPFQTVSDMPEQTADYQKQDKEGIEAEELAPFP
jgi:hypothetical protein